MNRRRFAIAGLAVLLGTSLAGWLATPAIAAESPGAVYTMTNAVQGNQVLVFDRDAHGTLTAAGAVSTGGAGSGGGLDPLVSQGSLVLTGDHRFLLAVNAGSSDVSVFRVTSQGLELVDRAPSGGTLPVSIATYHDLVYVLNAGGTANIAGFKLGHTGQLTPLVDATRTLGAGGFSQVGFDPRGENLVVTARTANALLVFPLDDAGKPASGPIASPSSGAGPFGFVFDRRGHLLVAEAGTNAVSSYEIGDDGTLAVISASVANGQTATCWITGGGTHHAFTASPGTHAISSYAIQPGHGTLRLVAGVAGTGARPLDMATSTGGRFVYALDPGSGQIDAFETRADGTLSPLTPAAAPIAIYAQGLAAR